MYCFVLYVVVAFGVTDAEYENCSFGLSTLWFLMSLYGKEYVFL